MVDQHQPPVNKSVKKKMIFVALLLFISYIIRTKILKKETGPVSILSFLDNTVFVMALQNTPAIIL